MRNSYFISTVKIRHSVLMSQMSLCPFKGVFEVLSLDVSHSCFPQIYCVWVWDLPLGKALGPPLACGLLASWEIQLVLFLVSLSLCVAVSELPLFLVPSLLPAKAVAQVLRWPWWPLSQQGLLCAWWHHGTRTQLMVQVSIGSEKAVLIPRLQGNHCSA